MNGGDHADHVGLLADFSNTGFTLEVSVWQPERGGQLVGEPTMRIIYGADSDPRPLPWLDLMPGQAGQLAGVLALAEHFGLVDQLADVLGGHTSAGEPPPVEDVAVIVAAPPPCPAWCRDTDHSIPEWARSHSAHLGRWRVGPAVVDINILQGDPHEPVVRVELAHDNGKRRVLELDAGSARTASDVLDFFDPDPGSAGEAAQMLFRAGDTIDPEHDREVPW